MTWTHPSLDFAFRPGPGETADTAEHPELPPDPEGQNSGREWREEIFLSVIDDDAGGLPHQQESNAGPVPEGTWLPPLPEDEPRSLPDRSPSL